MNNDKELFRQALQRQNERAAGMKMPDDMEQRVLERIRIRKTNRRWVYPAIVAVAASIMLLLVFQVSKEPAEKKTIVAETIEQSNPQPIPQPIIDEKKEEVLAEVQQKEKPAKKHGEAVGKQSTPVEPVLVQAEPFIVESVLRESNPEEVVPLIPAHKQALADIYLAEEALQVSYKLQAQQEAIRAYAVSLTNEDMPQPIIAY